MHRFYFSQKIGGLTTSILDAGQLHHLKDVLRLKIGDEVTIFDGEGVEYLGKITTLERNQAMLNIISSKESKPEAHKITIACALPKKSKMDDIIDKLTQLGIHAIIPLMTERVILKLDENTGERLERWRKIALSASEQSQRNRLPEIFPVTNFKELLTHSNQYGLKLIPTLEGGRKSIREIVPVPVPASVLVLIGPEGDFSPKEVNQAKEKGFLSVSLGENVLRVDTAAIAVASYLKFALL